MLEINTLENFFSQFHRPLIMIYFYAFRKPFGLFKTKINDEPIEIVWGWKLLAQKLNKIHLFWGIPLGILFQRLRGWKLMNKNLFMLIFVHIRPGTQNSIYIFSKEFHFINIFIKSIVKSIYEINFIFVSTFFQILLFLNFFFQTIIKLIKLIKVFLFDQFSRKLLQFIGSEYKFL